MSGIYYAIGGANYQAKESIEIDLDILNEIKKNQLKPSVLYIGVALCDDSKQISTFKSYYEELGFQVDVLYSHNLDLKEENILNAMFNHNVIYFGGGITSRLISFAKKYNIYDKIIKCFENNKIIAGVSAGAIMLFSYGFGDKEAFVDNFLSVNHKMTNGLGIFSATFCPHYQNSGGIFFHNEVKNYKSNGFAVENGAALKIYKNKFEIIKSNHSNVFMFDKTNNYKLVHLKKDIIYDIDLLK